LLGGAGAGALTTGTDGAIYMAGLTGGSFDGVGFNGGWTDAYLTKFNPDGNKVWTRLIGTSAQDEGFALTTGIDGAIFMAGFTNGNLDGQAFNGGS